MYISYKYLLVVQIFEWFYYCIFYLFFVCYKVVLKLGAKMKFYRFTQWRRRRISNFTYDKIKFFRQEGIFWGRGFLGLPQKLLFRGTPCPISPPPQEIAPARGGKIRTCKQTRLLRPQTTVSRETKKVKQEDLTLLRRTIDEQTSDSNLQWKI